MQIHSWNGIYDVCNKVGLHQSRQLVHWYVTLRETLQRLIQHLRRGDERPREARVSIEQPLEFHHRLCKCRGGCDNVPRGGPRREPAEEHANVERGRHTVRQACTALIERALGKLTCWQERVEPRGDAVDRAQLVLPRVQRALSVFLVPRRLLTVTARCPHDLLCCFDSRTQAANIEKGTNSQREDVAAHREISLMVGVWQETQRRTGSWRLSYTDGGGPAQKNGSARRVHSRPRRRRCVVARVRLAARPRGRAAPRASCNPAGHGCRLPPVSASRRPRY
ncbi:hypothetical protein BC834DRAFT_554460 [Gloeopeniophorella convolvens]|nr:hypothetical protein BC834DRAFT_554460 [Gloeopeniophorella convolvens]